MNKWIYLEIKINIHPRNKEQILSLINQLVEAESRGSAVKAQDTTSLPIRLSLQDGHDLLDTCFGSDDASQFPTGAVAEGPIGAWAMFNSFIPGKATLRVLGHLIRNKRSSTVPFGDLVDESVRCFRKRGLSSLRGFPASRKASSVPRFANHLLLPLADMGFIRVEDGENDRLVSLAEAGRDFSLLHSIVLDEKSKRDVLSKAESQWLTAHLRKIDRAGFKEYTILKDVTDLIAQKELSRKEIVDWFAARPDFQTYVSSKSKYAHEPSRLKDQLSSLASTYVSSKIAILRELGVLADMRGVYRVESAL